MLITLALLSCTIIPLPAFLLGHGCNYKHRLFTPYDLWACLSLCEYLCLHTSYQHFDSPHLHVKWKSISGFSFWQQLRCLVSEWSSTARLFTPHRWRTHKWQACTLVPDSVRQGTTGAQEACGRGLEKRGNTHSHIEYMRADRVIIISIMMMMIINKNYLKQRNIECKNIFFY